MHSCSLFWTELTGINPVLLFTHEGPFLGEQPCGIARIGGGRMDAVRNTCMKVRPFHLMGNKKQILLKWFPRKLYWIKFWWEKKKKKSSLGIDLPLLWDCHWLCKEMYILLNMSDIYPYFLMLRNSEAKSLTFNQLFKEAIYQLTMWETIWLN